MDNEKTVGVTEESGLNSKYMDSVHRDGTIWNIAMMIILLAFPVVVALVFQAMPDWAGVGKGLLATAPMYYRNGASLTSRKVENGCDTYLQIIGRGGLRHLTYNYTDEAWAGVKADITY